MVLFYSSCTLSSEPVKVIYEVLRPVAPFAEAPLPKHLFSYHVSRVKRHRRLFGRVMQSLCLDPVTATTALSSCSGRRRASLEAVQVLKGNQRQQQEPLLGFTEREPHGVAPHYRATDQR